MVGSDESLWVPAAFGPSLETRFEAGFVFTALEASLLLLVSLAGAGKWVDGG